MFNSLTGTITEKSTNGICLDTHGIEWTLIVPGTSLDSLPPVGSEARIFTHLVHTDDAMSLYGFASDKERALFLSLLKVDGIGPRGAVRILTNIAGGQLISALEAGDVALLEKVPGVGKKTAAKMLLALKGKLALSGGGEAAKRTGAGQYEAVVASLAAMGYDRRNAELAVLNAEQVFAKEADWSEKKQTEKEDALFRRALVEMAQ